MTVEQPISVDVKGIQDVALILAEDADVVWRYAEKAMRLSLQYLRSKGIELAHAENMVGVTGHYVQGFTYKMTGRRVDLEGKMYNRAGHAIFAEKGRKPGRRPPDEPIRKWVKRKGLAQDEKGVSSITFLIRRAIGRRGTIARFMTGTGPAGARIFERTAKEGQAQVVRYFVEANEKAAEYLARKIAAKMPKGEL